MTTYGLVHGAWHGAWCWDRLILELRSRGHLAIAMDLPCEEPDTTFADFARTVVRALPGESPDVVLVGHSLGSCTIPLVPRLRPVKALITVCGVIPSTETTLDDGVEPEAMERGILDGLITYPDGSHEWERDRPDAPIRALYHDCTPEDAAWAVEHLRRQNGAYRRSPPLSAWPDITTSAIVATDDRLVRAEWGSWAVRTRIGHVPMVELPGGHSPMIARPKALADALVSLS